MNVDHNVPVRMKDGILLSADVYRPDSEGRFPTVLTRSCYTKAQRTQLEESARYWTSHGYVFVFQDVRGRGDSEGVFYPLINESADGSDTLDWVASQSWSDSRVVMVGASYAGWTQLYAACTGHPALMAVAPMVTPPDPDRCFPVMHGMIMPAGASWLATLDGHINQDLSDGDVAGAFAKRPIIDFDRHIGRNLTAWRDWVEHPPTDPYWRTLAYQEALLGSSIPMLHISGWYDDCLVGTTETFTAMSTRAIDEAARGQHRLIIGPWLHGASGQRQVGEFDFGETAQVDFNDLQRVWFDARLRGEADETPTIRLFVMGRNAWIEEQEWPIAQATYTSWYLHSAGRANGRLGDGLLSASQPGDQPPDHFQYDPDDPVPYAEDFNWRQVGGPDNCATIELRNDILVYTGEVLDEPLLICGPLQVRLFAASSACDTDWTAKILDVHPDGKAIRLNDGVVRARFRDGSGTEKLLIPGNVEEFMIDCWSTCIELQRGHRLRLEIASSALGKIDVNLNGGGQVGRETIPVIAEQTVFHDLLRPSCLILPIVPARS